MTHVQRRPWAAGFALLCAGVFATEADAHAFLQSASPRVGSTVATSPAEVAITFTEGVEPSFSTIAVTNAAGAREDTGSVHLEGGDTRLAIAVRTLPPGVYKVAWHAVSVDTHRTQGRFTFTVGH